MHHEIVKELYSEYLLHGYISENHIFDAVIALKIPLDKVDVICETLLAKGAIIRDDNDDSDVSEYGRQVDYAQIYKEVLEIDESLSQYIAEVKAVKPPGTREWQTLFRPAQSGNEFARERILTMNLRFVVRIALWHHKKFSIPLAEAIQDGNYGLVVALRKFDIGKHNNFSQYASFWVRQLIMRHANPINPLIRYPVHYMDKLLVVYEQMNEHDCFVCGEITPCPYLVNQIVDKTRYGADEIVVMLGLVNAVGSLEKMIHENEHALSDYGIFEAQMNDMLFDREIKKTIARALKALTQREAFVLIKRFGLSGDDPLTLEQVGLELNVTRERIRQIEAKALRKLQHPSRISILQTLD